MSGTLSPDRYRLQATAAVQGVPSYLDGTLYQSLYLNFTAVPEPRTALLVAAGLVVMASVRARSTPVLWAADTRSR